MANRTAPFSLVNGRFLDDERARPWALLAGCNFANRAVHHLHRQIVTMISPLRVASLWAPQIPSLTDRPRELYVRDGRAVDA